METILFDQNSALAEMHHRIRNNLQMISSYLSLEMTLFPSKSIHDIIHSCQQRIISLSLIHENIYNTKKTADPELKFYLESLLENLTENSSDNRWKIQWKIDSICLQTDRLIQIGLLITEMMVASKNHYSEEIPVPIIQLQGNITCNQYILTYSDNRQIFGQSLPQESLSLRLIHGIAKQIHSEIRIKSKPFTEIEIQIPLT